MASKTVREWHPPQHVVDEYLAWLACRDEIERRSKRWYDDVLRVIAAAGGGAGNAGARRGGDYARGRRAERLAALQMAVYDEAYWLSGDERRRLRASGELPADFLDRVRDSARAAHRSQRERGG